MKTDYKVGDRVRVISRKYGHELEIGHIGVITIIDDEDDGDLPYYIDNKWWVTAEEIKPAPIDLNAKEPFFVKGDVKVWVWGNDPKDVKERYLYFIDNRCNYPYTVWIAGNTMKQHNNNNDYTILYKNASFTNPNKPEEKTIIIDGERIKLSAESFNNLKDFFNSWSENKSS